MAYAPCKLVLEKKNTLDHITDPWKREHCMRIWSTTVTSDKLLSRLSLFTFPLKFFFFNTEQFYSRVLSSKNLEKSSYYLSMSDGSRPEWLSCDQKVKLKNKCCLTVAGVISCFLNSHFLFSPFTSNLILFRYILSFAHPYPWWVVTPSSNPRWWIAIDRS